MGCTSEKSIPINIINKYSDINDTEINLDLHDIEKQGESKHPKIEINNGENIENEENNYYNYNLNDLISVNESKMQVKRIKNFEDDDESESENENENESSNGNSEENKSKEDEDQNNKIIDNDEIKENKINIDGDNEDKKPEDKKPPNIEKLKKKGKEKIEIKLFN